MSYPPLTPPIDSTREPPLHEMEWQRFERLTVALFGVEDGIATSDDYGPSGFGDFGVDVLARRRGGTGEEVASCKRTEKITAAKLKKWSDEFLEHWESHWKARRLRRFVLATTAINTGETKIQDQVTRECERFRALGIEYELWGRHQFVGKLRAHKAIARQFLDNVWAEIICGADQDFEVRAPAQPNVLTAAVVSQMADLQAAVSGQVGQRAEAAMNDLRAGRIEPVAALIAELRDDAMWPNIEVSVQAKIARLGAALAIRTGAFGDAERLNAEAEALQPSEERRIASQLALEREGAAAALAILGNPVSVAGKQSQAALLLMNNDLDEASRVVADLAAAEADDPETIRLSALCLLASGDRKGALAEIRRAEAVAGDWTAILHVGMVARYALALSPAVGLEWLFFPNPIDVAVVKRDDEAQGLLLEALAILDRMAMVTMPHGETPIWRLAVLAALRDRSADTSAYAAELLAKNPLEPTVVSWCLTRRLDVDLTPSIAGLKTQYVEAPTLYGTRILGSALAMREAKTAASFLRDHLPAETKVRAEAELWTARIEGRGDGDIDDRLGATIDAALESGDWGAVDKLFQDALKPSPPHPRALLIAQTAADWGQWHMLGSAVDRLLEFETAAAVRIAAFAAYFNHEHARALSIIDSHLASFGEAIPGDLRRMRADALMRVGDVQSALREADRITSDSGEPGDNLFKAEMMAGIGNLHASVPFVRQAMNSGMLDPNYALHWAQLLIAIEPQLSISLWRQAVAAGFDKRNVMAAMNQAFQLGLDNEAAVLMPLLSEQASSGAEAVRLIDIDEAREIIEQTRRDADEAQRLYLEGRTPAHMFAGDNVASFLGLYLGNGDNAEGRLLVRMTRHGARPPDFRAGIAWRDWVIHLDISGFLEASRVGLLDLVEAHPNGIRISSTMPALLMQMENNARTIQKTRVDVLRQLVDAIASRTLAVHSRAPAGSLALGFEVQLEGESDIHRLVTGLLLHGFLTEAQFHDVAGIPGRAANPFDLQEISALHLDDDLLEEIAAAGLLGLVAARFSLSTSLDASLRIHKDDGIAREQDRLAGLVGRLRQRLADGLQTGIYKFFRADTADDADDDDGGPTEKTPILERELRDLLQPPETVNGVVWIDDRLVTGYPKAGQMPLLSTFDILCEMEREKLLSPAEVRAKLLELRRAGAALIPFSTEELREAILDAPIHDDRVVETDALTVLRRSFAAAGRIERFLKFGDEIPELKGRPHEIDDQRNRMSLLADTMEAIWSRDKADTEDSAARSDWLWANMRVTQPNRPAPGGDTAQFHDRFEVMQISHLLEKAIDIGGGLRDKYLARREAFLHWLWDRVLISKIRVDPTFLKRIGVYVAEFSSILHDRSSGNVTEEREKILRQLVVQRILRLPPPIQREVFETRRFDQDAAIQKIVTVADAKFDPAPFWKAAQKAWRLGSATLKTLDGEAVKLERKGHLLQFSGALTVRLEDDILDCLVSKPEKAAAAFERFLVPLDLPPDEGARLRHAFGKAKTPGKIASLLADARRDAPVHRYSQIRQTLERRDEFHAELAEPPPFERFRSYLGFEDCAYSRDQLGKAYRRLRSRGLSAGDALHRLWGLPIALPGGMAAMLDTEEFKIAGERAITPMSITHLAAELRLREGQSAEFSMLLERLVTAVEELGTLQISILRWVDKSFFRDAGWRAADAGTRRLMVWSHADRLLEEFVRAGVPIEPLIEYLDENQPPVSAPDLFDGRRIPVDVGAVDTLTRGAILYHCLAGVFGEVPVTGLDDALRKRIERLVTQPIGEVAAPDLAIVMRGSAPNAMGSFLADHVEGLFDEEIHPERTRAFLIDAALDSLDTDPETALATWPQLLSVNGAGMSDEQFVRFARLFPQVDLWDLAFGEDEPAPVLWRAILIPMLRHDRPLVLNALIDLVKRARHHFGAQRVDAADDNKGSPASVLFELVECAALAAGSETGSDPSDLFCQLIEQYAIHWPEGAAYLRDMADNMLTLTPAGRAAPLWNLHLFLRTFP